MACHLQSDAHVPGGPRRSPTPAGAGSARPTCRVSSSTRPRARSHVTSRTVDSTPGVVCIDTATAAAGQPVLRVHRARCGRILERLRSRSAQERPIGTKYFAFNYQGGAPGRPASAPSSATTGPPTGMPRPALPAGLDGGPERLQRRLREIIAPHGRQGDDPCCGGRQRRAPLLRSRHERDLRRQLAGRLAGSYVGTNGAPFPLLNSSGGVTGVCVPNTRPSVSASPEPPWPLLLASRRPWTVAPRPTAACVAIGARVTCPTATSTGRLLRLRRWHGVRELPADLPGLGAPVHGQRRSGRARPASG